MKERISYIDGLRALAILVIVIHHCVASPFFWGKSLAQRFGGPHAVAFFFVLLGFCLEMGYPSHTWHFGEYGRFCLKRVARMWPLHALVLGVVLCLHLFSTEPSVWPNLFLLQSWSADPAVYFSYNPVSWFASAILPCYFIFPLATRCLGPMLVLALGMSLYGWHSPQVPSVLFNPCFHLVEVLIGMVACRYSRGRVLSAKTGMRTGAEMVAFATLLFIPVTRFEAFGIELQLLVWAFVCGGVLALFAVCRGLFSRFLSVRPLSFVGRISFEIFLLHVVVRCIFERQEMFLPVPLILRFPFYLLTVIALAWLLHWAFVEPVARGIVRGGDWLSAWFRRRSAYVGGSGLLLLTVAVFAALQGYRNSLSAIPWEASKAHIKTDGSRWARGDVWSSGFFLHPGDSPTVVADRIPEQAEVMKLCFHGQAGGDLLLRICIDGKERLVRRVQGENLQDAVFDVRGGSPFRIEVDNNGQLSCDGLVIDGPRFYRKANVQ